MMENNKKNNSLWIRVAQIAGAFAFIISMLLIVNYAQYKRIDPVETELINTLVDRLNKTPEDTQLREEIRALDLLVRKAYFTNQWQVRTGGYLLLLSIAVLVIAMQVIKSNSEKKVSIAHKEEAFLDQKNARLWISISGAIIVSLALVFAFLTHNELSEQFARAALPDNTENTLNDNETADNNLITAEIISISEETVVEEETETKLVPESKPEVKVEKKSKANKTKQSEDNIKQSDNNIKDLENNAKPKEADLKEKPEKKSPPPKKTESEFPSDQEIKRNYPTFRGPGGNGISYHKNIPVVWDATTGENILWKTKIPLHGYNSPIIWGDKIFLSGATSSKREVYCIDSNSGKILWTVDVKNIQGSPATSPKVTDDTGQAAPTLATDGKRVYAVFANGDIIAINMDGKQLWARNLGSTGNHYGHSSSLMLYQNILILQYDTKTSPKLMGLSVSTGETLWSTPRKVKVSWASPVVVNTGTKTEVLIVADPDVSSYDPITGKENWKVDCIFGEVGPSVGYADGVVYAVNEYAKLVAIKIGETPEIIWESDEYLSDVPSPVATKDLLFMATSYGVVVCYDAKTGEIQWEQEYDNGFYSSPILVEGSIYLIDMDGIMHIFSAENKFISLGDSPIGEDCMTTPAMADGRIYIRGNEHLFCIGDE